MLLSSAAWLGAGTTGQRGENGGREQSERKGATESSHVRRVYREFIERSGGLTSEPSRFNMSLCDMSCTNRETKPLTEPVLLILTSLAAHPRHGYALIKDIELLSSGRVRMSTGTLFGALRRLLEDGWIERFEQEDTARQKQAYRLTAAGRKQLQTGTADG